MEPIRVLLVDDHPMVRRGLRSLLSAYTGIEVVGEAIDGAMALEIAPQLSPDVIVLDLLLPGANGIDVASQLRKQLPEAKIIILSAHSEDQYVYDAFRVGAHAYLLKTISDDMIVETVQQVHQGQRLLAPELMSGVLRQFQVLATTRDALTYRLTAEEVQILQLIASGETNEDIGRILSCSERTIKRRLEEIMSKLGAKTRAQAVAEAIKRGLI